MFMRPVSCWVLLVIAEFVVPVQSEWVRHTIDQSSRGADGVRVMDINGDGLPDLVTGWEEGGQIRVATHPGTQLSNKAWPAVTVGKVKSPEDAVFVDLDHDGNVDVISCCEGKTRTVFVHWGSHDSSMWQTQSIPATEKVAMWMFAAPLDVDGENGVDLIVAAKGPGAKIGWLKSPSDARNLEEWKWQPLADVGWVMSIETVDMDGDGDLDILYSDRKSKTRGVHWLENESKTEPVHAWKRHTVGGTDREVMFLALGDVNQDGQIDIATTVKDGPITWFERVDSSGRKWTVHEVDLPAGTGSGKGIAIADVDLDGKNDLVYTCEHAEKKVGAGWLSAGQSVQNRNWRPTDISGTKHGIKFDLIQMLDLDGDGDLDLVTCEERDNLGVIWYENPTK